MFVVELSPAAQRVRALRSAMFSARAPTSGELVGVIVGERRNAEHPWNPAAGLVTVESLIVHGVVLPTVGRSSEVGGGYGWQLLHRARVALGNTLVVFLRNDQREPRELRAVLVLQGREQVHSTRYSRGGRARSP